ncbi:unnamed protein product [Zymoseptoria tritici ST99CH_3D1]|uniref:Uncharacterized protein n=1 Tax=Zymoseptoria tritici ST99CH_1E4 TaxID=1276532 RepID=A0A2H1H8W8_ZYMTR|nr:unnamed protein product [Zymoseptoria tritici ST99CH_1E4]SMR64733.1 unnamed protein product [Zymoseptoria tritici ST99CH_3D1]
MLKSDNATARKVSEGTSTTNFNDLNYNYLRKPRNTLPIAGSIKPSSSSPDSSTTTSSPKPPDLHPHLTHLTVRLITEHLPAMTILIRPTDRPTDSIQTNLLLAYNSHPTSMTIAVRPKS